MSFKSVLPVSISAPEAFAFVPKVLSGIPDIPREPHPDDFAGVGIRYSTEKPKTIAPAQFSSAATFIDSEIVLDLPIRAPKTPDILTAEIIVSEDLRPAAANRWHVSRSIYPLDVISAKGRVIEPQTR